MSWIARLSVCARKRRLSSWLMGLEQHFGEPILTVDIEVARRWGELTARARSAGAAIPASEGSIATIALRHGLHVMTRNTGNFPASGAAIIDRWETGD